MKKTDLILMVFCALISSVSAGAIESEISEYTINVICGVFNGLKIVGGAVATLVMVWAAIKWIGESDDPGARKNAKDHIKWAFIGIIIIVMADAMVGYVAQSPGVMEGCSYWCGTLAAGSC